MSDDDDINDYYDELGRGSAEDAHKRAEEMFQRILDDGKVPELLFRHLFVRRVVEGIRDMLGMNGVLELLCAIDDVCGWETEIIAERSDIENILLERYGAFDEDMWEKVRDTKSWTHFHKAIVEAGKQWMPLAVDEVVNSD